MRKLPVEYENPIDLLFANWCDELSPFFKQMNATPNHLTTISFIFQMLSIYYLNKGRKNLFLITCILGYFFDCLDGFYARKYKMSSAIGSYYDHFTDWVFIGLGFYYIYTHTKREHLIYLVGATIIGYSMVSYFMTCQESYYSLQRNNDKSHHLNADIKYGSNGITQKFDNFMKKKLDQEKYQKMRKTIDKLEKKDYLNIGNSVGECKNYEMLRIARYFGTGSLFFVFMLIMYYI